MNPRELGTVLAALRLWQRLGDRLGEPELAIATDEGAFPPLTKDEIDGLCERINIGGSHEDATPEEIARARERYAVTSDDDIEIDDSAKASRADDGTWVQAWVWLEKQADAEESAPLQDSMSASQGVPSPVGKLLVMARVASVLIQDLVGEYETPDQVPEWGWIQANASYGHRDNAVAGVWEFVINLSRSFDDLPERLEPAIEAARRAGASYLLVHQGT
jgi:hypothetical protein